MPIVARNRSLLAALASLALAACSAPALADDPAPGPKPKPEPKVEAVLNTLKLDLQITGVEPGWKIEVKPAHPGSRFKPVVRKVSRSGIGTAEFEPIAVDARSLSADRDCALAIVLTDPEGESQTFKRSVRLLPQPDEESVPELSKTFYLRTSTVATRDIPTRRPN